MIPWPTLNDKLVGTVLRSSSWGTNPGIIADETLSGKLTVRAAHIKKPDPFNIVMFMTLEEYRVFTAWWDNTDRRGVYTFSYPKINDNTGELKEYQFTPGSNISIKNTQALCLEISMNWQEAT
jgi:hypothetical protein